jgi:hypothetical protein
MALSWKLILCDKLGIKKNRITFIIDWQANVNHDKLAGTSLPTLDGKIFHDRNTVDDDCLSIPLSPPIDSPNESPLIDVQSTDMSVYSANISPINPPITSSKA